MSIGLFANLAIFTFALVWLARRQSGGVPLSNNVLVSLVVGIGLGAALQWGYGHGDEVIAGTMTWVGLVGSGYVRLLQMIVMPLVLVSILSAVTRLDDARSLGKISAVVLGILMVTTAISAGIGVGVTRLFGLRADGLVQGARELERGEALAARTGEVADLGLPQLLQSFIPTNIFSELTGANPTSIISVVIFASLLGIAALGLRKDNPELGQRVIDGIDAVQGLVMRLVRIVIRLTPYGVLALMTRVVATSNFGDILSLIGFVAASYLGLALILGMHAGLLTVTGLSPARFFKKIWPVLTFAFTSRSSAAAIPAEHREPDPQARRLTCGRELLGQLRRHHRPERVRRALPGHARGHDRTERGHRPDVRRLPRSARARRDAQLVRHRRRGRRRDVRRAHRPLHHGAAGRARGLLISIEPLIDMGRTAINVSGSMTAGAVTSRVLGETDMDVFLGDAGLADSGGSRVPELAGAKAAVAATASAASRG
jgi:uncharacterized protein